MKTPASGVNEGNARWNAEQEKLCRERFLVQFEERGYSDKFEFLGGRTSSKGKAKLRCKLCGCEFERYGGFCQQWVNIRCDKCHIYLLDETDAPRDGKLAEHMAERFLNGDSLATISTDWNIHKRYVSRMIREIGVDVEAVLSARYSAANDIDYGDMHGSVRQRIAYYGLCDKPIEDIDSRLLYARDSGVCHICGKKTDWNDCHYTDSGRFVCGSAYPTIDHVTPLAKGGSHTWDNVRIACFLCNCSKGARW